MRLAGPHIEHRLRTDDQRGLFHTLGALVFLDEPQEVGEGLDGFAETHVVGENAAEIVDGKVGEELEAIHLIGTQRGVERGGDIGVDLELDIARAALDPLPGLGIENLGSFRVGELQGMHAVRLTGEIEGIETEAGDCFALVGIELDFEAHPRAVVHANITAAGSNELADLRLAEIDALDVDDDAEVEPVDVLSHDFEAHGSGDGVGEDRLEAEVDIELHILRHVLDPLGEFLGELFGDARFERDELFVVGEAHFIEDGRHGVERLAGEAQQLFALDRVLLGKFPAVLGKAFGAAALGLDGGDVHHKMLGFCGC